MKMDDIYVALIVSVIVLLAGLAMGYLLFEIQVGYHLIREGAIG